VSIESRLDILVFIDKRSCVDLEARKDEMSGKVDAALSCGTL
jgi:hypothetical protein